MSLFQACIVGWFVVSVVCEVIGNIVFLVWLHRLGVPYLFAMSGTPGYLDRCYSQWCKENGRFPGRVVRLRQVSLINCVVAGLAFALVIVPVIASGHGGPRSPRIRR